MHEKVSEYLKTVEFVDQFMAHDKWVIVHVPLAAEIRAVLDVAESVLEKFGDYKIVSVTPKVFTLEKE